MGQEPCRDPQPSGGDRVFAAWRKLRRGAPHRAMRALYEDGDQPLEPSQVDVLDHVYEHGPAAMRDVAIALEIDASTATRVAERLVRRGLLSRNVDADDGRVVRLQLTPLGFDTCERYRCERSRFLELVFTNFSAAELAAGASFIERLIQATDDALGQTSAPTKSHSRSRANGQAHAH